MTPTATDDELDARLARADRAAGAFPAGSALERLAAETRRESRQTSLRRRVAALTGTGLLVVGGVAVAPAAADTARQFLAQLDWSPEPGGEILPDSEMVDLSAPDLPDYVASLDFPEIPLAPGQTREGLIAEVAAQWAVPDGVAQEVGIRHSFEILVWWGWLDELDAALVAGNVARQDAALAVLHEAPTWPAMVATDGDIITIIMDFFVDELDRTRDREVLQVLLRLEWAPSWDGVERFELHEQLFDRMEEERAAEIAEAYEAKGVTP